jgi:RND family efflux transporter MFP subunit
MNTRRRALMTLILFAGLTALTGCTKAKRTEAGPEAAQDLVVKAQAGERREWTVAVPISGSLRSQSIVDVKSEVGGRLISVPYREGDLVRRNDLLAEIDPVNYRLAYDQAAAAVKVAEAGHAHALVMAEHAKRESERADNLLKSGGITEKDRQAAATGIREAESQVRLAEAQIAQARAAVSIAEKSLKDCRILAPAEGIVQKRYCDQGSLLVPGSPLYLLVDNSKLELDCLLPSYRLSEIRLGQKAVFTTPTWGERPFEGAVLALNPVVESDNRSIRVLLRITNSKGDLRSGMYARGEIVVRREPGALVIPRTALMTEKEEASAGRVYVVVEGRTCQREVQIGSIKQDLVWIKEGLKDGEVVVVEIGPAIKDGLPVRVMATNNPLGS